MKIEDNFLDQQQFDVLQNMMMGFNLPWMYNSSIDYDENERDKFQFTHCFYDSNVPTSSDIEKLNPLLEKIKSISLYRIKANLLTKTLNIIENEFHIDIGDYDDENKKTIFPEKLKQWTTSIFYINTNNGYTKFEDGTKVESVANRLVTFPADMKHLGTSCTDEKIRVVINFNYFK